jgi:hypothetical protein
MKLFQIIITNAVLAFIMLFSFSNKSFSQTTEEIERTLRQQEQANRQQEQQQGTTAAGNTADAQNQADTGIDTSGNWSESFAIAFGIESAFGNTRSVSGTYSLRYSTSYAELWDFNVSLEGAYGESYDTGVLMMKKDRSEHKVSAGFDRWFFQKILAINFNASLETNEFSNVFIRWSNALGLKMRTISRWWIENNITIAPSVEYTKTYDLITKTTDWTMVYTFALNFNLNKTQSVTIANTFTFTPKFKNYKDFRINLTSAFSVKFAKYYTISLNFVYDYASKPINDYTPVKKSDYRLSTQLGLSI